MKIDFIQKDNIPYVIFDEEYMAKLVKLDIAKYHDLKTKNKLQGEQVPGYSIFFMPEYQWPDGLLKNAVEYYLSTKIEKKSKYFAQYKLPVGA